MEMNGVDQPGKGKLGQEIGKFVCRELLKGARHSNLLQI
jgi:hypothetical protein